MIIKIKYWNKTLKLCLQRHSDFSVFYDIFVEQEYPNLISRIKSGDFVIDAGANIGMFTVAASTIVGDAGQIISIEPDPENLILLLENIKLNNLRNVTVVNKALYSSRNKNVRFHSQGGLSKIVSLAENHDSDSILVETITLDDLLAEFQINPNVMKMDIEGGEKYALLKSENTMSKIDRFWIEIHSQEDLNTLMKYSDQFYIIKEKIRSNQNSLKFAIHHPFKTLNLESHNRFRATKKVISTVASIQVGEDNTGIYYGEKRTKTQLI